MNSQFVTLSDEQLEMVAGGAITQQIAQAGAAAADATGSGTAAGGFALALGEQNTAAGNIASGSTAVAQVDQEAKNSVKITKFSLF